MHRLWNFFIERRAFTYLVMISLIIVGGLSLVAIPKESAPEVEISIGIVSTVLPGASASDVEKLVTNKIEDQLNNLENLDKLTSSSREGVSVVTAQFTANADLDKSIQDLKDAVDRAKPELPSEAKDPTVTRVNFADQPILIISVSGDLPPSDFTTLAEELKNEIKSVSGISRVDISGSRDRQVQVIVRKDALDNYGLRLADVISGIASNNAALPIGNITVQGVNYALKFHGDIEDPGEVANIPVAVRNGQAVYVRDVAFVSNGIENATSLSRVSLKGAPAEQAITFSVYKKSGGNVVNIASAARNKLVELEKPGKLLDGMKTLISFDQGERVSKDLTELTRVGFETVALVMIALFLTIGWRESLVAGLSVPLSFVIAFIGLYVSGNTINFVSLFSLILAVGILVDSGIVVTEAIHTRYKRYHDPVEAARASIREYAWPLIAGTMTTVAVFVPLFFISGVTGKFIASIPFTIIFVLLASIIVALGMVPLLAIKFTKESMNRFEEIQEAYTHRIQEWYKGWLRKLLLNNRRQRQFIWGLIGLFIISLALPVIGLVKVTFFPQSNEDFVFVTIEKPQGTALLETDRTVRAVEEILYGIPVIDSFVTTVGQGSAFTGGGSGSKIANMTVILNKDRTLTSSEVVEGIRSKLSVIKDADISVSEETNGPPTGAPISIKLTGNDLGAIELAVDQIEHLLQTIPGAVDVTTSTKDNGTDFALTLDKAKAAEVGVSPALIAQTLRAAVSGTEATTIKNQEKDIKILVKLDLNPNFKTLEQTANASIDAVKNITIQTPQGPVLLGSIMTVTLERSSAVINHESKKRIATVNSQVRPGLTAAEVQKAFEAKEKELQIPEGVTVTFGGENEDVDKSFRDMFLALIGGMILMLSILVLEFNSFRYSFYLLSVVPLSLIGVLFGLAITGKPLSFPSMLGFIALSGVIINHGIILLDSMNHLIKEKKDSPLIDVVIEASAVRLRPIFLTSITTILGMIPLASVSSLWGPLATATIFGLSFAMVLTLILVPVLFYRAPKHAHNAA
jgi:multidrug efflux pump subunit AcrB